MQEASTNLAAIASYPRGQHPPCPSRLLSKRSPSQLTSDTIQEVTFPTHLRHPTHVHTTLPLSPPIQEASTNIAPVASYPRGNLPNSPPIHPHTTLPLVASNPRGQHSPCPNRLLSKTIQETHIRVGGVGHCVWGMVYGVWGQVQTFSNTKACTNHCLAQNSFNRCVGSTAAGLSQARPLQHVRRASAGRAAAQQRKAQAAAQLRQILLDGGTRRPSSAPPAGETWLRCVRAWWRGKCIRSPRIHENGGLRILTCCCWVRRLDTNAPAHLARLLRVRLLHECAFGVADRRGS